MSLSDRDVPMAKATFFIWVEKSSSMLALRGGASSARAQWEGAPQGPCLRRGAPRRLTRPPAPFGALALQRPLCQAPRKTSLSHPPLPGHSEVLPIHRRDEGPSGR